MNMQPAIQLNDVRKSFGKKAVLRGITGTVPSGTVVGLLGRNGEGKTTLFRIMLDMLASDSGTITVLDRSPDATGQIRKVVGYVPERPAFHEFMTVHEVFKLRASLFPTWNWEKATTLTQRLELDSSTAIKGASKGTLAKIAWICATAHNPTVLLLDEPTSGLDMVVRDAVLTHLVRELTEEGKTIMVANHHMEELLGVLDEIWILADGRIGGIYPLEQLRHEMFRVRGRLKKPDGIPPGITIAQEERIGDMVDWLVTGKDAQYKIAQMDLLENLQVEPAPLETTLKLLLAGKREE